MRHILCLVACFVLIAVAAAAPAGLADAGLIRAEIAPSVAGPSASPRAVPMPLRVASAAAPSADSLAALPPVHATQILKAIQKRQGEPVAGYVGGGIFHNRERKLPHGRYREYDVHPKTTGRNRGPERLVIEQRTGKAYYTGDHYVTFTPMN
jgi:ribonuclease T1